MFLQTVRLTLNYMALQPRTPYCSVREIYFSHHNLLVFAWVDNSDHVKYSWLLLGPLYTRDLVRALQKARDHNARVSTMLT
jgi:hypothetical protein